MKHSSKYIKPSILVRILFRRLLDGGYPLKLWIEESTTIDSKSCYSVIVKTDDMYVHFLNIICDSNKITCERLHNFKDALNEYAITYPID